MIGNHAARRTARTALVALLLALPQLVVAQQPDPARLPALPAGAGGIDKDAPKALATTSSGLKFRVLRKGSGDPPKATSTVTVRYHGWLDDGKVFASSYVHGGEDEFPLQRVMPGWTEGLQLVSPGGMIELAIPPKLAYGSRADVPGVPPDATLHFIVELVEVK